MSYRLYSFVANAYLSPLQCGLQTAHVVSEIVCDITSRHDGTFMEWATKDKTIIICGAGNHNGVVDCWTELKRTGIDPGFVTGAIFYEDAQSMNGMATACGVIVPEMYWGAVFERFVDTGVEDRWVWAKKDENGMTIEIKPYPLTSPEGQFITHIKNYRLA